MVCCIARRRFDSLGLPMRKKMMSPKRGITYMSKSQAVADDGLRLRGTMKSSAIPTIQKITIVMRALTSQLHLQIMLSLRVLVHTSVNRTLKRCLSCLDMGDKRGVVAFSLIRVCFGESSKRAVEYISLAQVAADQRRVT